MSERETCANCCRVVGSASDTDLSDKCFVSLSGDCWQARARTAERQRDIAEALLSCVGEVYGLMPDATLHHALYSSGSKWVPMSEALALLATNPRELIKLVPECAPIIERALAERNLTLENLP